MAIYEKSWWKKLFKKEKAAKIDSLKDIEAVIEFLNLVNEDAKKIIPLMEKLEELEKEREVGSESIAGINIESQAKLLDKILERYEFFQNDVDINGIRVKQVAKELLRHARKAGMKDLAKQKKENMKWKFDW